MVDGLHPPYRVGVTFGSPQVYADGRVHLFGTTGEAGEVVVYETVFDPDTVAWVETLRSPTGLTSGSFKVWTSQQQDGSHVAPQLRLVQSGGSPTVYDVYDVSGGFASSVWPTGSVQSSGSVVLSGLVESPSGVVWSPSGSWRLVVEGTAAVLRSQDGVSWERIPLPVEPMSSAVAGIEDDGVVTAVTYYSYGLRSLRWVDGEWFGPVSLPSSGVSWYSPRALISDGGSKLAMVTQRTVIMSSDQGASWSSPVMLDTNVSTASRIDDIVYVSTTSAIERVSFSTGTRLTPTPSDTGARVFGGSQSGRLFAGFGGAGLDLFDSFDQGATFDAVDSEPLPYGMISTNFHQSSDDVVRFSAVAVCGVARLVYGAEYDIATGTMVAHPVPLYLDESKTAVLRPPASGANNVYPDGFDTWFSVAGESGTDLIRIGNVLTSPEAVYGFDGYGLTANGVNAAIGNFVHAETDVAIPGVGPALRVTRTYNSADRRVGMFGRGWTSSYETRVYENCVTGNVTILHDDGRREFHISDGAGGYLTPPGYTSTLTKNGMSGWTLDETNGMAWEFRSDGRLTSISDADGQSLSMTWNASNQLETVTDDTSGRQLNYSYAGGSVSSVSTTPVTLGSGTPSALTWTYHHSGNNLAKVCDARDNDPLTGFCTTYTMTNGVITEIIDPNGNIDKRVSYAGGKVEWEENGEGDRTSFEYSPTETTITDGRSNTTTSRFDGHFRLAEVIDPLGNPTVHGYDADGFRDKTTDANGNVTERDFDEHGNVLWEKNGEGETTWFTYDQYNNVIATRDGRSAGPTDDTYVVTATWDGPSRNKRSESIPPPDGYPSATRTWEYTDGTEPAIGGGLMPAGLLETETDARSNSIAFKYDAAGNLREMIDRVGLVTEYAFDELGRRIGETVFPNDLEGSLTTTFALDELGNLVKVIEPATTNEVTGEVHQRQVVHVYDGASNLTQVVESDIGGSANPDQSRTTTTEYDAADRPRFVTDPESGVIETLYDDAGNVEARIDQEGRRHDYLYDERNLLKQEIARAVVVDEGSTTARDVTLVTHTYDAGGRLDTTTDALGRVLDHDYDQADRPTTVTLNDFEDIDGTFRDIVLSDTVYDAAGNPLTVVSGGGLRTEEFEYDEAGRVEWTTLDPTGLNRTTSFNYDANNNVEVESISDGTRTEVTHREYDAADRMTSETVGHGDLDLTTTFEYNNRGALVATVDPRGNAATANASDFEVTYEIDELGRTTRAISPPVDVTEDGVTTTGVRPDTTTGFNTYGHVTHARDERGNVTEQAYDGLDRLVTITHPTYTTPAGAAITPTEVFGYDKVGNLTSRTDRRGETTTFDFDGLNRAVLQIDPSVGGGSPGVAATFYDDAGNVITAIDQIGARVEYTYDDLDRTRTMVAVVRNETPTPDRYTTTSDYNDLGNLTTVEVPSGDTMTFVYNAASELEIARDADANETVYDYDLLSRQTLVTDPLGRSVKTEYDLAGRPVESLQLAPGGAVLTRATSGYDEAGNLTSSTSARGYEPNATPADFTTTYEYDSIGRLEMVTQPVSATDPSIVTEYDHDAAGNLTAVTNGEGHTTRYGYNEWNLRDELIEPATAAHPVLTDRTWTTTFDAGGLPVQTAEPGGVVVIRTFDELGRLTDESGIGGGAPAASRGFDYDELGRMTAADHPSGPITFDYDDRGLLTTSTGSPEVSAAFDYDENGRMDTRTDAAGTSTFTWTNRDELKTITDALTGTTRTHHYDIAGQLDVVTYSGGATRDLDFDDRGLLKLDELRDSGGSMTASYGYDYDADGYMTTRTADLPGNPASGTNTHDYDRAGRLISWTDPAGTTVGYDWDGAGNLIDNAGTLATFDERNQVLTSGDTTYTWTPRGTTATVTAPGTHGSIIAEDAFGEPDGNAPDPALWFSPNNKNGSTASVQSGEFEIVLPSVAGAITSLRSKIERNELEHDITVDYRVGSTTSTDRSRVRVYASWSSSYGVWAQVISNSTVGRVFQRVGGVNYQIGTFDVPITTDSRTIRVRFVDGVVGVKTWAAGDPEPPAWDAELPAPGVVGGGDAYLQAQRMSGSTSVWFDNWQMRDPVPSLVTQNYTFDALGRSVEAAGVSYDYDSLDRVTTDGSSMFGYAGLEIDPVSVGDLLVARSQGGLPVAAQQGLGLPFLLGRNSHGDIGVHYDATGAVSATRAYDPFGAVVGETGSLTPFGFQGDYTDSVTGDVWMGARWYRPGTSSFTSRDTVFGALETPISLNRYTYALADPLGRWDPDGRCSVDPTEREACEHETLGNQETGAVYRLGHFINDRIACERGEEWRCDTTARDLGLNVEVSKACDEGSNPVSRSTCHIGLALVDAVIVDPVTGVLSADDFVSALWNDPIGTLSKLPTSPEDLLIAHTQQLVDCYRQEDPRYCSTKVAVDLAGAASAVRAATTAGSRATASIADDLVESAPNSSRGLFDVRSPNPAHPPLDDVTSAMQRRYHPSCDCSEIAQDLLEASGGQGRIVRYEPAKGSVLRTPEAGGARIEDYVYHEVFTDGRYVYDPLFGTTPVPKGDYDRMIRGLNPGVRGG